MLINDTVHVSSTTRFGKSTALRVDEFQSLSKKISRIRHAWDLSNFQDKERKLGWGDGRIGEEFLLSYGMRGIMFPNLPHSHGVETMDMWHEYFDELKVQHDLAHCFSY